MAESAPKDATQGKPADQEWAELAASLSVEKAARAAPAPPAEMQAPPGVTRV